MGLGPFLHFQAAKERQLRVNRLVVVECLLWLGDRRQRVQSRLLRNGKLLGLVVVRDLLCILVLYYEVLVGGRLLLLRVNVLVASLGVGFVSCNCLGRGGARLRRGIFRLQFDSIVDEVALVNLRVLDLLDDRQVLLHVASVANAAKLKDGAEAVALELGSTLEQASLALQQDQGVLDDVFQNKIRALFIFSQGRVVLRLKQQQE